MILKQRLDASMLCQQYLNLIFANAKPYVTQIPNTIAETYGEILFASMHNLLATLHLNEEDTFIDLGSGLGKVVLQFFLQTNIKAACGIELNLALHQQAVNAAKQVYNDLPEFYDKDRQLTFLHGDFLEIPLTMATVLLISSPCFSPRMLNTLGNFINNTPDIHTVLTLKPIPALSRLPFERSVRLECSWDSALCYIYAK